MSTTSKHPAHATTSPGASPTTGQQAGSPKSPKVKPPLKSKLPSGPGLSVTAFVGLMRKLEPLSSALTDDQVRFVQLCLQRYQHEPQGVVKTKIAFPKPKRTKAAKPPVPSLPTKVPAPDAHSDAFLERLTHAPTEEDVMRGIEALTDARAEMLASSQGLRSNSPDQARQKLLETVLTLRQMSRIQNAGKDKRNHG